MSKLAAADLHWLEEDHFFLALVNTTIMVGGSGGGGSHTKSYTSNGSCYNLSLTVQVIRQHGQLALSELTHGVGLMAGSTSIDDRFQQYVRDLFGPANFDTWIAQHPQMFSKIKTKAWEDAKKAFDGTRNIVIDIPGRVLTSLPDEVKPVSS